MESISSRESSDSEDKEQAEYPQPVSPDANEDDAMRGSSPGSEYNEAVAISSPDIGEAESGAISEGSDQLWRHSMNCGSLILRLISGDH